MRHEDALGAGVQVRQEQVRVVLGRAEDRRHPGHVGRPNDPLEALRVEEQVLQVDDDEVEAEVAAHLGQGRRGQAEVGADDDPRCAVDIEPRHDGGAGFPPHADGQRQGFDPFDGMPAQQHVAVPGPSEVAGSPPGKGFSEVGIFVAAVTSQVAVLIDVAAASPVDVHFVEHDDVRADAVQLGHDAI